MEGNQMEPNFIVYGKPRELMSPFYVCTLLKMLDFKPRTDRCSVSTKQRVVKIYRNVEKKSMA